MTNVVSLNGRKTENRSARDLVGESAQPATGRAPGTLWRESVGAEIRRIRFENGERLVDTAETAGISPQYLSEVERGLKDPSSEILEAVAGALGHDVGSLMRRAFGSVARATPGVTLLAA
ncbi:helix-turn-helix domain-containing protein [Corynebacterium freneyi]